MELEPSGSFRARLSFVCVGHLKFAKYVVSCSWCLMLTVLLPLLSLTIEVV